MRAIKSRHEKESEVLGREVKSDGVEYTKVTDANALAMSLQGGEVDIAQDLTVDAAETVAKKTTSL